MRAYPRSIREAAVGAVLAAGFCGAAAGQAVAQVEIPPGWEIVTIADGAEFTHGRPDINDRGDIVFTRWGDHPDHSTREIFLYTRGELKQLTDDDIKDGFPRINNKQEIAWMRDLRGGFKWAIVLWRDGELEVISDLPHFEGLGDINDAGHIVWSVDLEDRTETTQLFYYNGESTQQVTNNGLSNQGARMNMHSQITWARFNFFNNPWTSENMLYDAASQETLQLTNGTGQVVSGSLNNLTQVVWGGYGTGVQLWEDFETVQVFPDGLEAVINDRGWIALDRWDEEREVWSVWLVRGGETFRITDGPQWSTGPQINARGEIAWWSGTRLDLGVALLTKPSFIADLDFDGDVDLVDYSVLQECFDRRSPLGLYCSQVDLDHDGDVDLDDYSLWHGFLEGPGR